MHLIVRRFFPINFFSLLHKSSSSKAYLSRIESRGKVGVDEENILRLQVGVGEFVFM